MQSSLIGKIQKAHLYAQEPDRIAVTSFSASFQGDHSSYDVAFHDGAWSCTCNFNPEWGVCSHVLATQRLMGAIAPGELGWLVVEETPVRG